MHYIRDLGLNVALQKTEIMFFHRFRRKTPQGMEVQVADVPVPVGAHIKYLGLVLDSS